MSAIIGHNGENILLSVSAWILTVQTDEPDGGQTSSHHCVLWLHQSTDSSFISLVGDVFSGAQAHL